MQGTETIETGAAAREIVRVAAMADIHYAQSVHGTLQPLFATVVKSADILLLCGDLVNYGLPEETKIFGKELTGVKIPIVAVLGNHEFESGKQEEVRQILSDAGAIVLDGNGCEIRGIGFVGTKGFAGGFGQQSLQPWGEHAIKRFVQEAVDESLKLESALARLRTAQRIALLHYAPIQATVEGEPREIFPFLGSSRLEEPLNRYSVSAVFHGHAHHGRPEGRTKGDVPVYNVAMKVLQENFPGRPPFRLLEIPVGP